MEDISLIKTQIVRRLNPLSIELVCKIMTDDGNLYRCLALVQLSYTDQVSYLKELDFDKNKYSIEYPKLGWFLFLTTKNFEVLAFSFDKEILIALIKKYITNLSYLEKNKDIYISIIKSK